MATANPTTKLKLAMTSIDKAIDALEAAGDSDDSEFYAIEDFIENLDSIKDDINNFLLDT